MKESYQKICTILLTIIVIAVVILVMYLQRTYTVTFDTKGGTIYQAARVRPNATIVKPEDPKMEGYIFLGWYLENTNEEYDFNSKVVKDITITAKWQEVN